MSNQSRIVVVGAGLCAAKAIEALRDQSFDGAITLIGDEPQRPYERPPLSKGYLQGDKPLDEVFVHASDWYADQGVETMFAKRVVAMDRKGCEVRLGGGEAVGYDQLLLATGSRPNALKIPGVELDGVFSLRTLGDSDRIRSAFQRASNVVVIGAGWIGLETAAAARVAGLNVTVLEYAPLPLQRALGDRMANHFADLHRSNGVDLRTGVQVDAIEGDGRVASVRVGGESISADVVIVGVGISPNVEIAAAAGLDVENGIVTDSQLRTSDPAIFAAGDVANAEHIRLGHLRVEHWDNAIRQGRLAATSMLGGAARYDWEPYFYTDQYDLGMEYVGRGGPDDEVVIRGDQQAGEFIAFWIHGGIVTAAMNVNIWDVNDDLRELVGVAVDVERLTDSGVALADLAH